VQVRVLPEAPEYAPVAKLVKAALSKGVLFVLGSSPSRGTINMVMSKLVAFGCSFTYGHGLPDCWKGEGLAGDFPSKMAWPSLLAAALKKECVNASYPGCSNIGILNNVLSYDFDKDDVAVILWTYTDRDLIFYQNKSPIKIHAWIENDLLKSWSETHNSYDLEIRSWFYIHHVYHYLQNKGIKFYFLRINLKSNIPSWAKGIEFLNTDIQSLRKIYPPALDGSHPGEACHKEFSHLVWNEIIKTL
jgi:hypothetical protein